MSTSKDGNLQTQKAAIGYWTPHAAHGTTNGRIWGRHRLPLEIVWRPTAPARSAVGGGGGARGRGGGKWMPWFQTMVVTVFAILVVDQCLNLLCKSIHLFIIEINAKWLWGGRPVHPAFGTGFANLTRWLGWTTSVSFNFKIASADCSTQSITFD